MRINFSSDRTVPGLAAEFLIIVIGVLVALGVDEWRTNRADYQREGEILADLLEEFKENRDIVGSDLETNKAVLRNYRRWIALTEQADPDTEEVFEVWQQLRSTVITTSVSGVLQSIIDSGELRLIQNRVLRATLTGWPALTEETTSVHKILIAYVNGPLLDTRIGLGRIDEPDTSQNALRYLPFTNAVILFVGRLEFVLQKDELLIVELESIITSLETELVSR